MAEEQNNTIRLAGVAGTECRNDPPQFCRCFAVNETPATALPNGLHCFRPDPPQDHWLLQTGDALLHPRPWFPAFGGMTTFDGRGWSLVLGLRRDDDSQQTPDFLERATSNEPGISWTQRLRTSPALPIAPCLTRTAAG